MWLTINYRRNLDSLGRDTRDVLRIVYGQEAKGAKLGVVDPAISGAVSIGKVLLPVLGIAAETILGFIRERQGAGIEAAKSKGVYKGRPVTLDWNRTMEWGLPRFQRLSVAAAG